MKKQDDLIYSLKKEINDLQRTINHTELTNRKIKKVKNLKLCARFCQKITPYILCPILAYAINASIHHTPFYLDKVEETLHTMTEVDNTGGTTIKEQYEIFEDSTNKLYYYSKWEKASDEFYQRTIQKYLIDDETYENIIELLKKEPLTLSDVLGQPTSTTKEKKNNLTEEQINEEPAIKAVIYNENIDDYIIITQSLSEDTEDDVKFIFLSVILEAAVLVWRVGTGFDYEKCVNKIKQSHQPLDVEALQKRLEIKQENYNRLIK